MLAAITCFFNPAGYENIKKNYFTFRNNLKGVKLFTIELSFNGEFVIDDAIHVHGNEKNILWQKERLLNLVIEELPAKYDKVAWVDADLIFEQRWAKKASKMLDEKPVIQLFETVRDTDSDGKQFVQYPSTLAVLRDGVDPVDEGIAKPGYAWACRRELIAASGLYDGHITGGGDLMMLYAWLGMWNGYLTTKTNVEWRREFLKWGVPQYRKVKSNVGCLDVSIKHMFHGTRENRLYNERNYFLMDHGYDPDVDVRIGKNGLFEWCSDKPEMHKAVADYFKMRKEDEIISDRS